MSNHVSSFGVSAAPPPLRRHGGRISAAALLPVTVAGDNFIVDGSSAIAQLSPLPACTVVLLLFTGTPTFVNSASLQCAGGVSFAVGVGDVVLAVSAGSGIWNVYRLPLAAATSFVSRAAVADANYTVAAGVSIVAYTSITAARAVALQGASSAIPGKSLLIVDESGACSTTNTITANAAGSDTINGQSSFVTRAPYGYLELESNGSNAWTVIKQDHGSWIAGLPTSLPGATHTPWNDGGVISTT